MVRSHVLWLVTQSCPTLCNPMDSSPPGSSVHGDSPGKNTGVGRLSLLQGTFQTQELNWGLLHWRRILYQMSYQGSLVQSHMSCVIVFFFFFMQHCLWNLIMLLHINVILPLNCYVLLYDYHNWLYSTSDGHLVCSHFSLFLVPESLAGMSSPYLSKSSYIIFYVLMIPRVVICI